MDYPQNKSFTLLTTFEESRYLLGFLDFYWHSFRDLGANWHLCCSQSLFLIIFHSFFTNTDFFFTSYNYDVFTPHIISWCFLQILTMLPFTCIQVLYCLNLTVSYRRSLGNIKIHLYLELKSETLKIGKDISVLIDIGSAHLCNMTNSYYKGFSMNLYIE